MHNRLSGLTDRLRSIRMAHIFLVFLLVFVLDRLVNYFLPVPVFVVFSIGMLPLLMLHRGYSPSSRKWLWGLFAIFTLIALINNLAYSFHPKNISDLLFILLFFIFYLLYESEQEQINVKLLHILTISMLVLFSFTFIGINSLNPILSNKKKDKYVGPPKKVDKQAQTLVVEGDLSSEQQPPVKKKKRLISDQFLRSLANPQIDYLEYNRVYHNGLFRVPQVASYLFGFIGLFYLYYFWNRKRVLGILIGLVMAFIVLYTGTRIFPISILVVAFLWLLLKPARWPYLALPIIAVVLMIIYRYYLIELTENTFLQQYFTFFATAIDNLPRLSRIILWNSWLKEIVNFNFLDLMIGKTYHGSLMANLKNVYISEWFHNDYFSISFSYGILCLLLYIAFFVRIYRDNRSVIKNNFFVFALYTSMPVMAFLNGFYYYFPMFTFYIYFILIQSEKLKLSAHENRDTWNTGNPQ